jgi:Flp pilus assembly pilin Flp
MLEHLKRLVMDDSAATAVEYAVMLAMILLVALVAIVGLGQSTSGQWDSIDTNLQAVGFGS